MSHLLLMLSLTNNKGGVKTPTTKGNNNDYVTTTEMANYT